MPADLDTGLPSTHFDFGVKRGARDQFEQWRWGVSPMFDLDVPRSELPYFYLNAEGQYFGDVAISRTRSTASLFARGPRVIARAGLDSITVMVYTDGRHRFVAGGTDTIVETGDIVMFDFTRPIDIAASNYTNMSLTIPRRLLEPLVGRMDRLHGLVLRRSAPMHGLLLGYMSELIVHDGSLTASAAEQISEATVRIVAAAAESASGGRTSGAPPGSIVARIRAEIEAQLGNPALDPDWLAEKFGMSRATLYRLFQEYGGVRHHIQVCRLLQAYRALARGKSERIGVIAERLGFPDQAAFSRAFRSAYGLSPREVADIAQNRDLPPPNTSVGFVQLNRWIAGLEPVGTAWPA
jgi:AraC-like DNA-binding protein